MTQRLLQRVVWPGLEIKLMSLASNLSSFNTEGIHHALS